MLLRVEGDRDSPGTSYLLAGCIAILCALAARVFWLQLEPPSGFIPAFEWLVATLLFTGLIGAHGRHISPFLWICIVLAFWIGELSTLLPAPRLGDSWQTFLVSIVLINVTPVLVAAGFYAGRKLGDANSWSTSHNAFFQSQFDHTKGALHAHRLPTQSNC